MVKNRLISHPTPEYSKDESSCNNLNPKYMEFINTVRTEETKMAKTHTLSKSKISQKKKMDEDQMNPFYKK